jgi:ABC-type polysaccharide/polyol phosphate transport system ATPase subunit
MAEPSIQFDSVWKKFRRGEHHDTLRDVLLSTSRRAIRKARERDDPDEFWAVQDVTFDVQPGETLGIIGGNGAGKSTILKLLTRIFRPNRGAVRVEGRIGALIEVSAGFHPDLTGRENIFLQGSLMGMRQAHIGQRFDEIVEFSGISEFLDTPVKRYSSGMNARLGFSIAAHLDPDVLIIDEVLAVGDFRFQQRAFGRIQELAQSGRPVVVVSHQLDRITQLCSKAVLLVRGRAQFMGRPSDCITAYLDQATLGTSADAPVSFGAPVLSPSEAVHAGAKLEFSVPVTCHATLTTATTIGIRVRSVADHQMIFATTIARQGLTPPDGHAFVMRCFLYAHLIPGQYFIEAYAFDGHKKQELSTSAPTNIQVVGDDSVLGRAHLGGRLVLQPAVPSEIVQA